MDKKKNIEKILIKLEQDAMLMGRFPIKEQLDEQRLYRGIKPMSIAKVKTELLDLFAEMVGEADSYHDLLERLAILKG